MDVHNDPMDIEGILSGDAGIAITQSGQPPSQPLYGDLIPIVNIGAQTPSLESAEPITGGAASAKQPVLRVKNRDGSVRTFFSFHPEQVYGPSFVEEHALAFASFMRSQVMSFVRSVAGMRGLTANDLLQTGFEDLTAIMRETLPRSHDMFLPTGFSSSSDPSRGVRPDDLPKIARREDVENLYDRRIAPFMTNALLAAKTGSAKDITIAKGTVEAKKTQWVTLYLSGEPKVLSTVFTAEVSSELTKAGVSTTDLAAIETLWNTTKLDAGQTIQDPSEINYSTEYGKEVVTDLSNLARLLSGFGNSDDILRVYRYLQTRSERYDFALVKWLTLPMNLSQLYFKDNLKGAIENALSHVLRLRNQQDNGALFAEILNSNQSNDFAQLVARYLDQFQFNRTVGDKRMKEGETIQRDIDRLAFRLRVEGQPVGVRGLPALTPNASNTLAAGEFNPI
jgi:hypothetical protein